MQVDLYDGSKMVVVVVVYDRQMCAAEYLHSSSPFRNDVRCTKFLQSRS